MSDLFEATAERLALASGRPKSQELAELRRAAAIAATIAGETLLPGFDATDPCADCLDVICDRCDCPRRTVTAELDLERLGVG